MSVLPRNIPVTAATPDSDDYVQIDGATNASRKFLIGLLAFINSPIFTGVPKAPTPTGLVSKAITTVDYVTAAVNAAVATAVTGVYTNLYPVGEIIITRRSANPSTWLGFGTWVAYGAGRTLVGYNAANTNFNALDKTGGVETVALSTTEMPAHTHLVSPPTTTTSSDGAHTHTVTGRSTYDGGSDQVTLAASAGTISTVTTSSSGAHTHTVSITAFNSGSAGTGAAHTNLQPYITVFMWQRTA